MLIMGLCCSRANQLMEVNPHPWAFPLFLTIISFSASFSTSTGFRVLGILGSCPPISSLWVRNAAQSPETHKTGIRVIYERSGHTIADPNPAVWNEIRHSLGPSINKGLSTIDAKTFLASS